MSKAIKTAVKHPFSFEYRTIHRQGNTVETLGDRLERQRLEDMGVVATLQDDAAEFFDSILDESHLIHRVLDLPLHSH